MDIYMSAVGCGALLPIAKEDLLTAATLTSQRATSCAVPYKVKISPYPNFERGPLNENDDALENLVYRYLQGQEVLSTILDAVNSPCKYVLGRGVDFESLLKLEDELRKRLTAVQAQLKRCAESEDASTADCKGDEARTFDPYEFAAMLPAPYGGDPKLLELSNEDLKREILDRYIARPARVYCTMNRSSEGCRASQRYSESIRVTDTSLGKYVARSLVEDHGVRQFAANRQVGYQLRDNQRTFGLGFYFKGENVLGLEYRCRHNQPGKENLGDEEWIQARPYRDDPKPYNEQPGWCGFDGWPRDLSDDKAGLSQYAARLTGSAAEFFDLEYDCTYLGPRNADGALVGRPQVRAKNGSVCLGSPDRNAGPLQAVELRLVPRACTY